MINQQFITQPGTFNKLLLHSFKVLDDKVGASANANTGIAYDRFRKQIYISSVLKNIQVFSEDFRLLGELPYNPTQGIAYDSLNDVIIAFAATTQLRTYARNGALLYSQTITLFGLSPGTACYDEIHDCLYLATTGTNIRKLVRTTGYDWAVDSDIPTTNYYDGIGYDMHTNTIYYHTSTLKIRQITLDGTTIREFDRPKFMASTVESMIFNPNRKTLLANSPAYYHGGQVDGNRVWEMYPNYTAW